MVIIRHITPGSLARVFTLLYAALGLIFAIFFFLVATIMPVEDQGARAPLWFMILFIPIIYGFFGFISGYIVGALYNLIAKEVGGIEMVLEEKPNEEHASPQPQKE